ncbi:MAG: acyltransferase family protein [Thermotogota bacterium]
MEKRNQMLYSDVMKGFLISAVIIGHSLLIVTPYLSSTGENLFFSFLCKVLSPCVFCFFYFFGYGQGLKRKRNNSKRLMKRVSSIFFTYCIWASFAWVSFQFLGSEFNMINNAKGILLGKPFTIQFLSVLFTFTGSWQYYFIFIFIVSMFLLYFFKHSSLKALKVYLAIFSTLQVSFFLIITVYLYKAPVNQDDLRRLGIMVYANPIAWSIPLFWGYYRAAARKQAVGTIRFRWFYFILPIVYLLAVSETYILGRKWNGYYLLDQFTLLTLLNSVLMLFFYDFIIKKVITKLNKDSLVIVFASNMGRYSIIPFFVHLPYQWYLFVLLTQLTHLQLNPLPAFIVISTIGLCMSYYSIKLIDLLPVKIKRLLMGI